MTDKEYEKIRLRWRAGVWANHLQSQDISGIMDIYTFGVFAGQSTIEWAQALQRRRINYDRIFLFDSFQGIPPETEEKVIGDWDPKKSKFYSGFNASEYWGTDSVEETINRFRKKVTPFLPGKELIFISGFFEDSLHDGLIEEHNMRPAFFVDIDTDIYTSAKQAMDWIARNDLLSPGITQVGYDDWGGLPKKTIGTYGESRAHRELSEKHNQIWEHVMSTTARDDQIVFRYLGNH